MKLFSHVYDKISRYIHGEVHRKCKRKKHNFSTLLEYLSTLETRKKKLFSLIFIIRVTHYIHSRVHHDIRKGSTISPVLKE